ncbi:MAG: copper chaperone PCu(A)C [Methylovirgula sp.]
MKSPPRSQLSQPAGRVAKLLRFQTFVMVGVLAAAATVAAAQAAATRLTLSNQWMRLILPSRPVAGYFTLTNPTAEAQTLVGATSPSCGMLMLHQSLHESGQERMVMAENIVVPAHGAVTFAPGGYHLMCTSPGKDVRKGYFVPVTLRFADGTTLTANFPVRGATGH